MRYKAIIAYDGTGYAGWQRQPHEPTIAGALEKTFKKVFGSSISLLAASRTDAGVHAHGQVIAFDLPFAIDATRMKRAWNGRLPNGISVRDIQVCDDRFNPRYHVAEKTYYYQFFLERPLPCYERYGWYVSYPVDLDRLDAHLAHFVGTHDFSSFATIEDQKNPVRTITNIFRLYDEKSNMHTIVITGPTFLRYMIRRIVGAALDAASRPSVPTDYLARILAEKNPRQRLFCAPAKGLVLMDIRYI